MASSVVLRTLDHLFGPAAYAVRLLTVTQHLRDREPQRLRGSREMVRSDASLLNSPHVP